jgi:hypothetical protein
MVLEYDLKFKFNFILALFCAVKQRCPLSVVCSLAAVTHSRKTLTRAHEVFFCFVTAGRDNPDERGLFYLVFKALIMRDFRVNE